jgi:uncharacterized membrane protein (TIGR02234 family)
MVGAVLLCAAGAGLALFAGSRTWLVEIMARPASLGPVSTARTGLDLLPALAGVSLVALAGAGAVLATRGWGRRLVGALIVVGGLAAAGLALSALERDGVAVGWVLAASAGGLMAAAGGTFTLVRGAAWPELGARYERPARAAEPLHASEPRTDGSDQVGPGAGGSGEALSREYWDALDRGDDPTKP